jgi:hypothetical protein
MYIIDVLSLLAQEAGITDENFSSRTITVANDVLAIERYLAEVGFKIDIYNLFKNSLDSST